MFGKIKTTLLFVLLFVLALIVSASLAAALPWDTDMAKQQSYKSNEMVRSPVKGTVAVGAKPFSLTLDEAEKTLKNPMPFSLDSVWRGRRIWGAQCAPCHGKSGDGEGPVGPKILAPSLLTDYYRGRGDGRVYAIIHNGGTNMPRYGYKLSPDEHWDVVNYLRFLQGRDVEGIVRPK